MSMPTKDTPRVRMNPARSASTRSHAGELARMRARRRRKKRLPVFPVVCVILLLVITISGTMLLRDQQPKPPAAESYPIRYSAEIEAAAQEFGLEPAHLYAVVLAESSFRPDAVSSVGAVGLMQIMPDTGRWLAGKLGMKDTFTPDMLTDPAVNVRLGSWYLRFLLDRYGGDMTCATAAFHAGQGTVDQWLSNPAYSPDDATLAFIEYDSTSNYVKKVLKYYEKYLALLSASEGA